MKKRITITFTWHIVIIGFLVILFALCAIAFGGYKLYQKVLTTEMNQKMIIELQNTERLAKEEEANKLITAQQAELIETKAELEKTKTTTENTNAQVKSLTQTLKDQSQIQKEIVISSSDLSPYVTGVVQVVCSTPQGISSGSGSLFSFKELKQAVLTNYHVVKDATKCVVVMTDTANTPTGIFSLEGSIYTFNASTDEAVLSIGASLSRTNVFIGNYNYTLSSTRKCASPLAVGSPVVIIGYPAYAKRDATINLETIGAVPVVFRTTTNGIISGYDTSTAGAPNYFVSAKIDSGNSGGIALAKDSKGICTLGLPTWLTVGNYETQGLVQNIINILPANEN